MIFNHFGLNFDL